LGLNAPVVMSEAPGTMSMSLDAAVGVDGGGALAPVGLLEPQAVAAARDSAIGMYRRNRMVPPDMVRGGTPGSNARAASYS
jgi:hypothetical protein